MLQVKRLIGSKAGNRQTCPGLATPPLPIPDFLFLGGFSYWKQNTRRIE